jgi:hypothetical protein
MQSISGATITIQGRSDRLGEKLQLQHTSGRGAGVSEVDDPGPNGKVVSC